MNEFARTLIVQLYYNNTDVWYAWKTDYWYLRLVVMPVSFTLLYFCNHNYSSHRVYPFSYSIHSSSILNARFRNNKHSCSASFISYIISRMSFLTLDEDRSWIMLRGFLLVWLNSWHRPGRGSFLSKTACDTGERMFYLLFGLKQGLNVCSLASGWALAVNE